MVTLIRNADWVVAWNAAQRRHEYRRNADVAFDGGTLIHVGPGYGGAASETIDGRGRMVIPGLVDVHGHPGHEPAYRGLREEHGVRAMYMTGLFERSQAYALADAEGRAAEQPFPRRASHRGVGRTAAACVRVPAWSAPAGPTVVDIGAGRITSSRRSGTSARGIRPAGWRGSSDP